MLIADPLVELHDASENDNGEMGAVGAILRGIAQQAGCATMVIHHTRQLPAGSSEGHAGNMDSGRGAGDRTSVVSGKSVSRRVERGGRCIIKKKKQNKKQY